MIKPNKVILVTAVALSLAACADDYASQVSSQEQIAAQAAQQIKDSSAGLENTTAQSAAILNLGTSQSSAASQSNSVSKPAESDATLLSSASLKQKSTQNPCPSKSIALSPIRTDGYRSNFAWPQMLDLTPGSVVISPCVRLTGIESDMTMEMHRGSPISINNGPFVSGPVAVKTNDEVRVQFTAPSEPDAFVQEYAKFSDGGYWGTLAGRVKNADRPPQTFQVGATRNYKQLNDVAGLLRAGDTVEVDSGTYLPAEFRRAGSATAPITIRGVGNTRPIISGGTWGVSFRNSHNIVFENFEVTASSIICVRNQANNIVVRNTYIHDCPRLGVLGTDLGNGLNVFDRVEFARTGAIIDNEPFHHALYVATDRDAFPDAALRVQYSYFHDNKGNSIKSRSARNEIYFNWIDVPQHAESYYTLELIGFQEYLVDKPIDSDVVGNMLIHRGKFGMRFGGDGVGSSQGKVRMLNNTIVYSKNFGQYDGIIRITSAFDALLMINNAFIRESGSSLPTRLFYTDVTQWMSGSAKVTGFNNQFPSQQYWDSNTPFNASNFKNTLLGDAGISNTTLGAIDGLPTSSSALLNAGYIGTSTISGYEIDSPLTTGSYGFRTAPSEGSRLAPNQANQFGNIGVY